MFALSRGIGWILNYARDITTESRVMECPPDEVVADMVRLLAESMRAIDRALEALGTSDDGCDRCGRRGDRGGTTA